MPSRCPAGKQCGPGRNQTTTRKKWTKEENKTAISCYLKATKESKRGYRKQIHNLWNEIGMFENAEQQLACQAGSIFKNNRLAETEIQQLRGDIEKDEIALERVDTVSKISYGGSSGTETVRKQDCGLKYYPGGTPEDHIKNLNNQRLIEIIRSK